MAESRLTTAEVRAAVRSPGTISSDPFKVAASLAAAFGTLGDVAQFRDLLLRALDNYDAFGEAAQVIDGLVREVGLFPYLSPTELDIFDRFAYEVHRPQSFPGEEIVFHGPQARVYWKLLAGENVILSAPTSFGKSLIIDAIISSGRYSNILIVVPTIALIDETRRRLAAYSLGYKLIAHPAQRPAERNVYILTQERTLDLPSLDDIDFFVIDEFYKLAPGRDDNTRSSMLNLVFHKLATKNKPFYLLGPDIEGIVPQLKERLSMNFMHEPYPTVATEIHRERPRKGDELNHLVELMNRLEGQSLVFCKSPLSAARISRELSANTGRQLSVQDDAFDWISSTYHPEWHFAQALKSGIGVHHGRIPRALAQYAVRSFNESGLVNLVCTSTLIEGVNTKARNVVVFDNKINRTNIDFFTFNNICGRSGRMFKHFVGHIYLFHEPPQRELPLVDVPAFSQSDQASASLLLQLSEGELTPASKERLSGLVEQNAVSVDVLRAHPDVEPVSIISLARELEENAARLAPDMQWTFDPTFGELCVVCDLIWAHFNGARRGSGCVRSARQLAVRIFGLRDRPTVRQQIEDELAWSNDSSPDAAVQTVLDFNRLWATFHFPKLLMVIQEVQREVFSKKQLRFGDFSSFAARVEHLFLPPVISALDEYGIPFEVGRKIIGYLGTEDDIDVALEALRKINISRLKLHPFEERLLTDAIAAL